MKKALFYIENSPIYMGYTNGEKFKGCEMPKFELEVAQAIQAEINQGSQYPMFYDVANDEFYQNIDGDVDVWKGKDYEIEDGIKHLYEIGNRQWQVVGREIKLSLAQTISDFLYDYDPYEYRDAFDDEDEVLEAIISNFDDIKVLAEAHRIINDNTLSSDQIFSGLSEILNI